jgi:phosphoglucosamine mutase
MKLFGTDGIRGRVNEYPITPQTVVRVGMAIGKILFKKRGRNMVLIGKDTRLSGYMIESALTSGICSMGMNVTLTGPIPTPGVAFLTRTMRFDAGIVISASHNPYEDNGIKIFTPAGYKLPDEQEREIEELVLAENGFTDGKTAGGGNAGGSSAGLIGKAFRLEDAAGRYIEFVKSTIPRTVAFDGFKVVVDCANGAAYKITPTLLKELGATVVSINDNPDGKNINAGCGALHLEKLREAVLKHRAHMGIAHDGDADRTLLVDETGGVVDGDRIMAVWANDLKAEGRLLKDTVVATVMSNLGLQLYLETRGIRLIRANVGDRFVVEKMIEEGCNFGGEQSGHIVSLDLNTTGDGPITALQMLNVLKKSGQKTLSQLVSDVTLYPQVLKNVGVTVRRNIDECPQILAAVRKAEQLLGQSGRVLVRPSGTEPKIRIMIEGPDKSVIDGIADDIASAVTASMVF